MDKEKQIEEMAVDLCLLDDCKHLPQEECDLTTCVHCMAEILYEKGYRKSSEVAREIFEEIEKLIYSKCFSIRADRDVTGLIMDGEQFAELKKKYTESEDTE